MARVCSLLVVLFLWLTGIQGLKLPRQAVILSEDEIDNVSDSPSEVGFGPGSFKQSPIYNSIENSGELPVFEDPKIYGMNIGLHFILESINIRVVAGSKVPLESLIKVLVLTHNIEKVGGTVNVSNRLALKHAVALYPEALKEALKS